MSYNDDSEYLNFLVRNNILICSEDYQKYDRLPISVIGEQDWDLINTTYEKERIVVIDNFLKEDIADRLRKFFLFFNIIEEAYPEYGAINFLKEPNKIWFPLLTNITEEIKEVAPFLEETRFIHAWAFIYNTVSNGVPVHADPASTNINLWVTPNECMNMQEGYNGLDVWRIYPPKEWEYRDYNGNVNKITEYLTANPNTKVSIPYNFNRAVIFDSMFFHKSNPVYTKPGYDNRRINYTFLYERMTNEL